MYKILFLFLSFVATGCSLLEYSEQAQTVSNAGVLTGNVQVTSKQKGHVVVVRFRKQGETLILEDSYPLSEDGQYRFTVLPGSYLVAAFIDSNHDRKYEKGEHGNFHTEPLFFTVEARQTSYVPTIIIQGPPPEFTSEYVTKENFTRPYTNIGRVVSLDNAIFSPENYSIGTWKPVEFLEQIGGGLMMLQPYNKHKIPLVFVHGINSGPTDWRPVIDAIDQQRFQVWVLYYPSGVGLDVISNYFAEAMAELDNRYHFKQFYVAAHSMGGLITRVFMEKYLTLYPSKAKKCKFVMTVNSPMNGLESAASGVNYSPIVVASWRDVASNSDFITRLHDWHWPKDIPYHLVFSYQPGKGSDDVVPLESQIPFKLQQEAVRMYGFESGHTSILSDEQFIQLFKRLTSQKSH